MSFKGIACAAASALLLATASFVACRADDERVASGEPFAALAASYREQTGEPLPRELRHDVLRAWLRCEEKGIAQTDDAAPRGAIVFYHCPYGPRSGRLAVSNGDGKVSLGGESLAIDTIPGRLGWVAGHGTPAAKRPAPCDTTATATAPVSTAATTKPDQTAAPGEENEPEGDPGASQPAKNPMPAGLPGSSSPAGSSPAGSSPAQSSPAQSSPAQSSPAQSSPAQSNTGSMSPSGQANAGNTSAQSTPAGPAAGYNPTGDGGTAPGGRTSSKGFIMLPASGEGFFGYTADRGRWGTQRMIYGIERGARAWITDKFNKNCGRMAVGDVSLENGGKFAGHASHQKGVDADFALPQLDGRETPRVDRFSANYSQIGTQNEQNFLRRELPVTLIFFNDPKIAGARPWPNHDNHFHVRIQESGQ